MDITPSITSNTSCGTIWNNHNSRVVAFPKKNPAGNITMLILAKMKCS